jgi:hypothetical protein
MADGSIVALAGRRIDAQDADPPRFPLEAVSTVRQRLADLLVQERTVALVCSAACGSDLIAPLVYCACAPAKGRGIGPEGGP